jgi:hypothetical protein
MIVLTDDAERRIAGAPVGSVCEEAGADAYPNQHNLPLPAPGRGRVARYNSDVDGNRGSYRTYSRPEYFAFEAARSARAPFISWWRQVITSHGLCCCAAPDGANLSGGPCRGGDRFLDRQKAAFKGPETEFAPGVSWAGFCSRNRTLNIPGMPAGRFLSASCRRFRTAFSAGHRQRTSQFVSGIGAARRPGIARQTFRQQSRNTDQLARYQRNF